MVQITWNRHFNHRSQGSKPGTAPENAPSSTASRANWCWAWRWTSPGWIHGEIQWETCDSPIQILGGGIPTPLKLGMSVGIRIPKMWKNKNCSKFQTTNQSNNGMSSPGNMAFHCRKIWESTTKALGLHPKKDFWERWPKNKTKDDKWTDIESRNLNF